MAVSDSTLLSLLGKNISFSCILDDEISAFFPDGVHVSGVVQQVCFSLDGANQILVDGHFYFLSKINFSSSLCFGATGASPESD
jgi:hypothetical protein